VIEAMGAGRKAARSMKVWLGIRDTESVYLPERAGSDGTVFGIDIAEKTFARVHLA
jgi:glutamate synthase (NADPH/NADH) small chain